MALRKKVKSQNKTITVDVPKDSDLQLRLEKIAKHAGLSCFDMIQKWVLQEEFVIGLMQHGKKLATAQTKTTPKVAAKKTAGVKKQKKQEKQKKTVPTNRKTDRKTDSKAADYRKTIVKKIEKLKKEGATLKKIAETFNNEKVPTMSGSGKWYTSSISWLVKSVKAN